MELAKKDVEEMMPALARADKIAQQIANRITEVVDFLSVIYGGPEKTLVNFWFSGAGEGELGYPDLHYSSINVEEWRIHSAPKALWDNHGPLNDGFPTQWLYASNEEIVKEVSEMKVQFEQEKAEEAQKKVASIKKREAAMKSAREKLTPDERAALGLGNKGK